MRAHVGERDPRRLLHHVAELPGQDQALVALHRGRLDEEDVAAGAGHGQPGRDAGDRGALDRLLEEALAAERVAQRLGVEHDRRLGLAGGDPRRRPAQQLAQFALELAHAGLAGVLGDDAAQDLVAGLDLLRLQPVALELARQQVAAGDRQLLVGRVAVEGDRLHAVQQRRRDRVDEVGGGEEDDLGEVDLDVEVVVAEGVVLRRVEHLEQGRRRVAAPVGADLVDLVEQDHRVHRLGVAQGADDPPRQRADVGAAVAADLGLVVQAAEADADELASQRPGDRLADRGLAGAGRADQGQDRAVGAAVLARPRAPRAACARR